MHLATRLDGYARCWILPARTAVACTLPAHKPPLSPSPLAKLKPSSSGDPLWTHVELENIGTDIATDIHFEFEPEDFSATYQKSFRTGTGLRWKGVLSRPFLMVCR